MPQPDRSFYHVLCLPFGLLSARIPFTPSMSHRLASSKWTSWPEYQQLTIEKAIKLYIDPTFIPSVTCHQKLLPKNIEGKTVSTRSLFRPAITRKYHPFSLGLLTYTTRPYGNRLKTSRNALSNSPFRSRGCFPVESYLLDIY